MGVIKQGILGGFSGSVANVTGSSWKGIAVMKGKPLSVSNPRTAAQQAQRGKFSNVVAFAVVILSQVIKPLWDRFATKQSGYNAFCQANIDVFDSAGLVTPADLVISQGKMASTPITAGMWNPDDVTISAIWADDSGNGYKLATDVAYLVGYNATQGIYAQSNASDVRSDKACPITFASNFETGDVIHLWLAFRRADGTVVSNTSYYTTTAS